MDGWREGEMRDSTCGLLPVPRTAQPVAQQFGAPTPCHFQGDAEKWG